MHKSQQQPTEGRADQGSSSHHAHESLVLPQDRKTAKLSSRL